MSFFKDKAIVIKIDKIKDKELLYTFFTYEYGKIKANKKISNKEKPLDLGYVINFEIITKENVKIHKIKNIKIKSEFNLNKDRKFNELNIYLEILGIIFRELPDGISNKEVFSIIEFLNSDKNINETKIILSKLKLKSLLGTLNINHDDNDIAKVLKFISNSKIDEIFKLKLYDTQILNNLREI